MPTLINNTARKLPPQAAPVYVPFKKLDDALLVIGGLSAPSKMPWYGWSVSALDCITGSKLRLVENSTCSTCYALKGRYTFPNVLAAHRRRKAGLAHPQFVEAFVFALNTLFLKGRKTYERDGMTVPENRFRWFDSGDLDSVGTLSKIVEIAVQTPHLDHWLPTREIRIVKEWMDHYGEFPENLAVRISTPMIGDRFNGQPMGLPFSTVGRTDKDIAACPAPTQNNMCGDCRACWDKGNVSYAQH